MTLPTTKHRLVLADYDEIIDASKKLAAEPRLAETVQIVVVEDKHGRIDEIMRENQFRAITTILTECAKHRVLEAFKWRTGSGDSSTRPAEFWEALAKVAPNLQHLSLDFYTHELGRMNDTGISVRGGCFESLHTLF